jgi:hypothetical protein
MKLSLACAAAAASVVLVAAPAAASVTYDSAGYGFVGKGDVQTGFGWNNKTMQQNFGGVSFTFESEATYSAVCTFTTGNPDQPQSVQTHDITIPRHTAVNATVAYEARRNSKGKDGDFTGWYLNGFGETTTSGTAPVLGESCVGSENGIAGNGTWTSVTQTGETAGGLYAHYGSQDLFLPLTPVV